jgi:hypothetical protein
VCVKHPEKVTFPVTENCQRLQHADPATDFDATDPVTDFDGIVFAHTKP